jgi:hypothetical protein
MKRGKPRINGVAYSRRPRCHLVGFLFLASVIIGIGYYVRVHPTSNLRDGIQFPGEPNLEGSAPPSITQPPDQHVLLNAAGIVVAWTITDPENSSGIYLVAHDVFDPMENVASLLSMMRSWANNTAFNVPVDTSQADAHNYTIFFSDMSQSQLIAAAMAGDPISWGMDTVWITVETPLSIQAPVVLRIHDGEAGRVLSFSIIDPDSPTGFMNVTMNGSNVLPSNTRWNASQVVSLPVNASVSGFQDFLFIATDGNYTVNRSTTVWVSADFPPEIQGLQNRTVSPDIGTVTFTFKIMDMENVTGNYTALREGLPFNASFSNATWTNDTIIYLDYSITSTGRVDFQAIAEDLSFNEVSKDFYVYVNIPPTVTAPPESVNHLMEDNHDIYWTIHDADNVTGTRVLEITTPPGAIIRLANSTWQSGTPFSTSASTTYEGTWNYTLFFSDGYSIRRVTTIVTILPPRLLDETGITMVLLAFIAAGFIGFGSIMAERKKKN